LTGDVVAEQHHVGEGVQLVLRVLPHQQARGQVGRIPAFHRLNIGDYASPLSPRGQRKQPKRKRGKFGRKWKKRKIEVILVLEK
jgi:hypothetical protein